MLSRPHSRSLKYLIQTIQPVCETHAYIPRRVESIKFTCQVQHRSFHSTFHVAQAVPQESLHNRASAAKFNLLPRTCPGCGALTHNDASKKAGYYGRQAVKDDLKRAIRLGALREDTAHDAEQLGAQDALKADDSGADAQNIRMHLSQALCDRCIDLSHQKRGTSISHPTVESLAAIIDESPFQDNHVYHVLDAADFPASLIPNVFNELSLVHQRSQNRRAKSTMYKRGHTTTISFIITRADILLPQKQSVDRLMPYFVRNLKAALGKYNERARMGNVHLVSSKRGWWTKELKEEIRHRGGANWMVGKANVGKSNLFEVLYPKGTTKGQPDFDQLRADAAAASDHVSSVLMPPPQPLVPYPNLPLVSSLPGTTASPIRLPFVSAHGKLGELIDLPGLFRSPLERFIEPNHQQTVVMNDRPKIDSISLRPRQSLLIGGGLVRITPDDAYHQSLATTNSKPYVIIQAHPFLPPKVRTHLTSTQKCLEMEEGTRNLGIGTVLSPSALSNVSLAAEITLDKDVTKSYAAKLLRRGPKTARKFKKTEDLPFRIFAADLVIEGVGWVELTAQVRIPKPHLDVDRGTHLAAENKGREDESAGLTSEKTVKESEGKWWDGLENGGRKMRLPRVLVYTPGGKGVLKRETAEIWNATIHGNKPKKDS